LSSGVPIKPIHAPAGGGWARGEAPIVGRFAVSGAFLTGIRVGRRIAGVESPPYRSWTVDVSESLVPKAKPWQRAKLVAFAKDMADTIHMMALPSRLIVCLSVLVSFQSPFLCYGQDSRKSDAVHYFRFYGQPFPASDLRVLLERQILWDDTGQNFLNPSGLQLSFEKIDEQTTPGGRVAARYRVLVPGAPENKVFAFESWPVGKKVSADSRDIYVNGQGLLMIHRPKPEQESSFNAGDDELEIAPVTETAEPIRFVLTSKDGQLRVFGTLVPHPLAADDQGCRLEVRIAQPESATFLIVADRFPENAKIPLVLESEGMIAREMLLTDSNGHAVMAGSPSVPHKAQGTFKATAEGPHCLPSVLLPWSVDPHAAAEKTPEKTRKH